ncbi:MAG: hypothetical protein NTZ53_08160 [Cyanobacteria bacterium]|nr:hypothetical protein [Cyanobacteriota bacterium]
MKAAVIINALEQGNDVVFAYAGRLDTTGFNVVGSANYGFSGIIPGSGEFLSLTGPGSALVLRGGQVSYN